MLKNVSDARFECSPQNTHFLYSTGPLKRGWLRCENIEADREGGTTRVDKSERKLVTSIYMKEEEPMAQITMKAMLDAGVHFGHQTQRWNPKMKPYVFTSRGGIHIIDLHKSVDRAKKAADFVKTIASQGGRMIFVGTKKQAVEPIQEAAKKCGQFYVTKRWLGGMMTNFATIKASIDRLRRIDGMREKGELEYFSKKERAKIEKEYTRLVDYLDGIRDMKDSPSAMFVVDLNKEHIAVAEARRLGIPVIGIADTNVDPELIEFPIPGNDDAIRSIKLFANLVADAFMEGAQIYEQKIRANTDKGSDFDKDAAEAAETKKVARGPAGAPQPVAAKPAGPSIVKATKTRKLVAAGLADDVEIAQELDEGTKPEATTEEE
jgi:small subunit ribosomal protein S2